VSVHGAIGSQPRYPVAGHAAVRHRATVADLDGDITSQIDRSLVVLFQGQERVVARLGADFGHGLRAGLPVACVDGADEEALRVERQFDPHRLRRAVDMDAALRNPHALGEIAVSVVGDGRPDLRIASARHQQAGAGQRGGVGGVLGRAARAQQVPDVHSHRREAEHDHHGDGHQDEHLSLESVMTFPNHASLLENHAELNV